AKNNHIQVDLLYRYLPHGVARTLSTFVDVARIAFFAAMVWFTVQMMMKMESYKMTIVDLPMNIVYGVCLFGFVGMMLRSVWVARVHWQRGYSVLERPESTMADR
ncbi:MAG TPA: TRAP transporter small permease subunit, partial [Casimicrobium huifangae]|nr:TRAP transporter small permease subunit [Casimicrobium huifangae]